MLALGQSVAEPQIPNGFSKPQNFFNEVPNDIKSVYQEIQKYFKKITKFKKFIEDNLTDKLEIKTRYAPPFEESTSQSIKTINKIIDVFNLAILNNLLKISHFHAVIEGENLSLLGVKRGSHGSHFRLQEILKELPSIKKIDNLHDPKNQIDTSKVAYLNHLFSLLDRSVSLKEQIVTSLQELGQVLEIPTKGTAQLDPKTGLEEPALFFILERFIDKAFLLSLKENKGIKGVINSLVNHQKIFFEKELNAIRETYSEFLSKKDEQIEALSTHIKALKLKIEREEKSSSDLTELKKQLAMLTFNLNGMTIVSNQVQERIRNIVEESLPDFLKKLNYVKDLTNIQELLPDTILEHQNAIVNLKERILVKSEILNSLTSEQKASLEKELNNYYLTTAEKVENLRNDLLNMMVIEYDSENSNKPEQKHTSIQGQITLLNMSTKPLIESVKKLQELVKKLQTTRGDFRKTHEETNSLTSSVISLFGWS